MNLAGSIKTGYQVIDCMTLQPVTITRDSSLSMCAKLMNEKHVGSLLVMEKGQPIGLITEQDLVRKSMAIGKDPYSTRVDEVMERELITISPNADIYEALKVMRDYNIRHLPVTDNTKLVGFLTLKDILKIQPQLFELIVEKFELREESRKLGDSNADACDECGSISNDLIEIDGQLCCPACRGEEE